MIGLTVRSFAEMLRLPVHEQVRILNEQKYPRREPQIFRIPYYQVAATGIRRYYRSGRDPRLLSEAIGRARLLNPQAKRTHNERVLRSFQGSAQANRDIRPVGAQTSRARLGREVELRVKFDLEGIEGRRQVHIFYNFRNGQVDADAARNTLRIAHWVLSENGIAVPIGSLEFVDLFIGDSYSVPRQSQRTLRLMEENAGIITTLWPTL